jgi:hypothetical protein
MTAIQLASNSIFTSCNRCEGCNRGYNNFPMYFMIMVFNFLINYLNDYAPEPSK